MVGVSQRRPDPRLHPEKGTSFCKGNSIAINPFVVTKSFHEKSEKDKKSQQNDRSLMFSRTKSKASLQTAVVLDKY